VLTALGRTFEEVDGEFIRAHAGVMHVLEELHAIRQLLTRSETE